IGTAAGTAGNRAVSGRSHRRRYVCPPVRDSRTRGRPANNGASTAQAWAGSGTGERRFAGSDGASTETASPAAALTDPVGGGYSRERGKGEDDRNPTETREVAVAPAGRSQVQFSL